jgi:S1-C subfamily serine protease
MYNELKRHKTHRNVLYSLVAILVITQMVSFFVISSQVSKINSEFDKKVNELNDKIKLVTGALNDYNEVYQGEFQKLNTNVLSQQKQQDNFNQQISLLKLTSNDFSEVIKNSVMSVVSVSTDKSIGSGFVINGGYVVTNYHILDGASKITVRTNDDKSFLGELAGFDKTRDVALIRVDTNSLNAIKLGNSNNLKIGEKIIAIGNPLGLSFSASEGIISALDRVGPNGLTEYIQTDVSLNPGNSGGPLINQEGEVVGMNNFKISDTEGLGFALRSNSIRESINNITGRDLV